MSEFIKDYYTNMHSKLDLNSESNGHRLSLTYSLREALITKMLTKCILEDKNRILDAGCGNGYLYNNVIKPHFPNIEHSFGIDYVKEAVEIARKSFTKAQEGNVLDLQKLVEGEYSFVNSTEVFLYIPEKDRKKFFLEHMAKVKKDGYFLLTVPNLDSIYRKLVKPEKELFPYHFNQNTILELSEKLGLNLVSNLGIDIFKNIYKLDNGLKTFISFELAFLFKKS
ncbi:MAG: class I SAM-dependent methyltransferase [Campylobacterales bacterium]|nr:class I SAM-dependent methyltransferase [Campylobacterales bacterium]